jgi:broad specificity phosphatase PhoE
MAEIPVVRLLVVRHGETDLNRTMRMQGVSAHLMNERGRRQIEAAARRVAGEGFRVVFASDLPRAVETARTLAAGAGAEVRIDPRLREQNLGDWEGEVWPDLPRLFGAGTIERYQTDPDFAPPGGESRRQVLARMDAFLSELPAHHPGETVLAVGHGGTLLVLMYRVLGIPLTERNRFYCGNGSTSEFAYTSEGWRLVTWNETAYLRAATGDPASSA